MKILILYDYIKFIHQQFSFNFHLQLSVSNDPGWPPPTSTSLGWTSPERLQPFADAFSPRPFPRLFRKKTGREEASSSVATRLALTVEGSTVTQAINQRRWSFPSLEMSSFLKKDFFMMSPFNWQLVLIFMRSMNIGRLTWNPSKQAPW